MLAPWWVFNKGQLLCLLLQIVLLILPAFYKCLWSIFTHITSSPFIAAPWYLSVRERLGSSLSWEKPKLWKIKWFAQDLGLTSVQGGPEIQSFWHILASSLNIPSSLSNRGQCYCPRLWGVTQRCIEHVFSRPTTAILYSSWAFPRLQSVNSNCVAMYKSLCLSVVGFLLRELKCLAYCLGHKCSVNSVCYLSDGDDDVEGNDAYYYCAVYSGCAVWQRRRFNMEALGLISCGLTAGDSFSRNEGLFTVFSFLHVFLSFQKNQQQESFVTRGPLVLPQCFHKMLLIRCSQKPSE